MSRPPIREDLTELAGYHSAQVDVKIRLNTNESPAAPPAAFHTRMAEIASTLDWHRYPDRGAGALRDAIGALYGMPGAQVFAANGSNEVLQTLLLTFGGPNRTVVTFEPTYAMHGQIARTTGTRVVSGERDERFMLSADHAIDVIRREEPIITFLCSPNNPTGIVESEELVRAVLAEVEAVNGLLVVDEAYGEFSPWSAVDLIDEDVPLVVTRTFSKTWAMAAARLGYLLGPAWLVERLFAVVLPYHLDSLKQQAGVAALAFSAEMEERVATIVSEREKLLTELTRLGVEVWRSGSNFVLFRPPAGDGRQVWDQLLARDILVRDCSSWEGLDGTLRVTVGNSDENTAFLAALGEILETP